MKDVPEIAPEIRALLEEIVANPRSAIRLAPRRALRSWFDSGERVRATDVSRDRAVRHLVAAHREELAALLQEASFISYWKAPVLSYRPTGADGKRYDPTQREPQWRHRAKRVASGRIEQSEDLDLLRTCLEGIQPHQGRALAMASLALVPSDRTRYYVALSVPWTSSRFAIVILRRLANHAYPSHTQKDGLLSLAARTCSLGLLATARDLYREHAALQPKSPVGWTCSFNLSCFLGDELGAKADSAELERIAQPKDPFVIETSDLLKAWAASRPECERRKAAKTSRLYSGQVPEVAACVCRAFES